MRFNDVKRKSLKTELQFLNFYYWLLDESAFITWKVFWLTSLFSELAIPFFSTAVR
jgi:hypothetical protein